MLNSNLFCVLLTPEYKLLSLCESSITIHYQIIEIIEVLFYYFKLLGETRLVKYVWLLLSKTKKFNKDRIHYYYKKFFEKNVHINNINYYIMIELTFLRELMLIKQVHQEHDICNYWYFLYRGFKFQWDVYNECHDLLMMTMNLSNIAILNINSVDFCCIINRISKK